MNTYQINSMTGYGRGEVEKGSLRFITEMRAVNHRYLDVVVRYPQGWMAIEDSVRALTKEHMRRGRVDVFLSIEGVYDQQKKLHLDEHLLQDLLQIQQKLSEQTGIKGNVKMRDLLAWSDLWSVEENALHVEDYQSFILGSVEQACLNLLQMRRKEGQHLTEDLLSRLQTLKKAVDTLLQDSQQIRQQQKMRLQARVQELLQDHELPEDRLAVEVAILADRADISEELTRMQSHYQQFSQTLLMNEPIGRKLDFIIQEMNREVNTIGSKANHEKIGKWVVECKSELEKMREQVQNIE